jgi:glycosyltransferase involved in cell wall biosynthesis
VVHKENGGLSDARNAGMDVATGAYYYFVDSDDRLPAHSIMTMYQLMQNHHAQMVIGGFERFYDGESETFFSTENEGLWLHVYNQEEAFRDFYRDGCQSWAVLYRRHIHENIRFPKGEINEDEAIVFQILQNCQTVVVTNQVVYSYRCRPESITTSSFNHKKLVWVKHCVDNLAFIQENHPNLTDLAANRYRGSLMWSLTEMILSNEDFSAQIQDFRRQLRQRKELFHHIPFISKQEKLRFFLLTNSPLWLYRLIIRTKRRNIR